ncbi:MAG: hypothetical protein WKF84_19990 [Pyrinomonadaceae bacterium]
MIILDTDCISLLERNNADAALLRVRMAEVSSHEAATTIITFEEPMRGWLAHTSPKPAPSKIKSSLTPNSPAFQTITG